MYFEEARRFLYRNARPLDLARWRFHFENGSQTYTLIIPSKEELSFSKRTLLEIMCKYGEYGSMAKTELMKSYMYAYTLRHSERRSPPRWAARMRARLV